SYGWFVMERQHPCSVDRRRCWRVFPRSETDPINAHRSSYVFEALFAQIVEGEVETPGYVLLNAGGHANASGLGQTFQPSRDVHAVTENVAVLNNNIANVDAYAKFDAFLSGDPGITLGHGVLNLSRTSQGFDDT